MKVKRPATKVIRSTSPTARRVDPKDVAYALGAEIVPHDRGPILQPNMHRRFGADEILARVAEGQPIRTETMLSLIRMLQLKGFEFHLAVEVQSGSLLKTIDNERDAVETILRLRNAANAE